MTPDFFHFSLLYPVLNPLVQHDHPLLCPIFTLHGNAPPGRLLSANDMRFAASLFIMTSIHFFIVADITLDNRVMTNFLYCVYLL